MEETTTTLQEFFVMIHDPIRIGNSYCRFVKEERLQIVTCRKREDLTSLYIGGQP